MTPVASLMHTLIPKTTSRLGVGMAVLAAALLSGAADVAAQPEFCEDGGLIVLDFESTPPTSSWIAETIFPGFTGTSYYRWDGPNHFNQPGNGVLTYTLNVTTAGLYNMRIYNLHDDPDNTLENDCWSRMDGGTWQKSYSSINLTWNWATWFDPPTGSDSKSTYMLSAGTHTFEVSARSHDFRIDRVHFFLTGYPNPQNPLLPETTCDTTWTDLGNGLAGTGGQVPVLQGTGNLMAGSTTTISLSNALPTAPAYFILGLSLLNAPFKGGVLVPSVDILAGPVPVDPAGDIDISFAWPAGSPSGISAYWQTWVVDAGGPFGYAATNGLQSVTP